MIRTLAYSIIITLFLACALISLLTGEGGIHEFEVTAPGTWRAYATFLPSLFIDTFQFMLSCVSWEFLPGLPKLVMVPLITLSTLPVVVVFIMDILPPLATAVGKIIDAIVPG